MTALVEVAVQLELATIPPYLTAYWSIKDPEHPVALSLFEVVLEEMQHLGMACNLLVGLGGRVNLRHLALAYPCSLPGGLHPGLTLSLQCFSAATVTRFMAIEYPESEDDLQPSGAESTATIGGFYELLEDGLALIAPKLDPARQVTGMGLSPLHSVADMHRAIETIKRQGEGSKFSPADSGTEDLSHYHRFKEMLLGRRYRFHAKLGRWDWAEEFDVPAGDAVWPSMSDNGQVLAPDAAGPLNAFDAAYSRLLDLLDSCWAMGDARMLHASAAAMSQLGILAGHIMRMPRPGGDGHYGPRFRVAGPVNRAVRKL